MLAVHFLKRCEDASHSKALRAKRDKPKNPFREALGVRTRPRVAFGSAIHL